MSDLVFSKVNRYTLEMKFYPNFYRLMVLLVPALLALGVLPACTQEKNNSVAAIIDVPKQRNVIVIVIDTLRPDHLGAYGYERNTSPFIDSLAQEGVVFEHAYASPPLRGNLYRACLAGCRLW